MSEKITFPDSGLFITLEGGEGSGKSTIIQYLKSGFESLGLTVTTLREPGGTKFSEDVREIFMKHHHLSPETSVHLINAQRQDNLEYIIKPALKKGHVVIADRYTASTLIYQGLLNDKFETVTQYIPNIPQYTILVDVRPEIGLSRIYNNNRETNRFDEMDLVKHQTIYEGYHQLGQLIPDVYWDYIINGEKTLEQLRQECVKLSKVLSKKLKDKF